MLQYDSALMDFVCNVLRLVEVERRAPAVEIRPMSPVFSEVDSEPPVDYRELEEIKTQLFGENKGPYYTYDRVPWVLEVRKEVRLYKMMLFFESRVCFFSYIHNYFNFL